MNTETDILSTEEKIFLAAETVFMRDGYDGARMQSIADEAGMNKALLHYYFRSKDLLFERIFAQKIAQFFPDISNIMTDSTTGFTEKMCLFVETYIKMLIKNPYLPLFIISSVNKPNYEGFIKQFPFELYQNMGRVYQLEVQAERLKPIDFYQFLLSVVGMCVFPFLSRPIISHNLHLNNEEFLAMMQERIGVVQGYVRVILSSEK